MTAAMAADRRLQRLTRAWLAQASRYEYSYHFTWLGRPVIQFPQDIVALQEIVWNVRPDLVVETGIARGGSLIFYASLLALMDGDRRVVGVDVDLRPHNRTAIEEHPLANRITVLDGSSTSPSVIEQVHRIARGRDRVVVILDSLHTHDHVLSELRAYSSLIKPPGYLVVLDTIVEDLPASLSANRPWGPGDNPKSAVAAFLEESTRFVEDTDIHNRLLITAAAGGYLRCVE